MTFGVKATAGILQLLVPPPPLLPLLYAWSGTTATSQPPAVRLAVASLCLLRSLDHEGGGGGRVAVKRSVIRNRGGWKD